MRHSILNNIIINQEFIRESITTMSIFKKIIAVLGLTVAIAFIGLAGYQTFENRLTVAEADTSATTVACDPSKDLTGSIDDTNHSKATITNKSTSCSYSVGFAAYHTYQPSTKSANYFTDQDLFSHKEQTIAPNKTITVQLSSTDCDAQYDLFYGDLITSFANGQQYGSRKLDYVNDFSKGVCTKIPPKACANDTTLSLSETKSAIQSGKVKVGVSIDTTNKKAVGTVTNNTGCNLPVSLITYKMYDQKLSTQVFFDGTDVVTVKPNTTEKLYTNLPSCMAQNDLYYGAGPHKLYDDNRDANITLAYKFYQNNNSQYGNASGNFCKETVTPPTPPAPTASSVCVDNSNSAKITVKWSDASQGAKGYHVDITSNSNFNNGGWYMVVSSGTTQITVTDFNAFKAFGSAPGNLTLTQGKTYKVRMYYVDTAAHSSDVSVTAAKDCHVDVPPTPPTTFSGTCVASSSYVGTGATVTYTANAQGGNSNYSYSWTGTDNLSGNNQSISHIYWTPGSVNAQVVITSNGQSVIANCSTTIYTGGGSYTPPTPSNLSAVCSANPTTVTIGQTVTWKATASNGNGNYSYSWTGTDNLSSSINQAITSYSTIGQKQATVTVTSNGQTVNQTCYVNVVATSVVPPTGGIYLSQVPYTGIGSNMKVALFILALLGWSAIISYILIKRKAAKNGMTIAELINGSRSSVIGLPTMSAATATAMSANSTNQLDGRIANLRNKMEKNVVASTATMAFPRSTVAPSIPKIESVASPFVMPTVAPVIAAPVSIQSEVVNPSNHETVIEALEIKARELQTLVSADGLEVIAHAASNNKNNALIILNHLVELYKGSDYEMNGDWMVLNGEKITSMLSSTYMKMTPVFIEWLAQGDDRKILAFMRMLQMQGQSIGNFVTNVVIELDKTYRFRMENTGDADSKILNLTAQWSNEELEYAIHTLVSAVDQTYTSTYASVKVALIKIIEIAKAKSFA